jgi:predicted NBD/HSP70 family sugar kinase
MSLRRQNLALALRCIADAKGSVSRADISARTALNKSTSSSLVDELIAAGLVRELGVTTRPAVGRPPTSLALVAEGPAGLGIEVNVDYIAACVVDLGGAVRYQHVVSQDQRGQNPQDVLRRAVNLGGAAVRAVAQSGLAPAGVGIAIPGLVDSAEGRVVLAPNLGWSDLDFAALLGSPDIAIPGGVDVVVDNEANYAALSERELLIEGSSFLYVFGEIGVGAGLVLGGDLHRGRNGWSGEIGHITVERDGPFCGCGGRGCLEQYAGQEAILRAAGAEADAGTSLGVGPTVTMIRERAERGDRAMTGALDRAGRALGLVVASVMNLLDIDRVVLGGIYKELSRQLLPVVREEVAYRYAGSRWALPQIQAAVHGSEAPALGAARSVVRQIIDDPAGWLGSPTGARGPVGLPAPAPSAQPATSNA